MRVLRFALPIIVSNIFQVLYQLIDAFWVGKLGNDAVAALSASFPIMTLLIALGIGLATATRILISHNVSNPDKLKRIAFQGLLLSFGVGTLMAAVGWIGSDWLLEMVKTPEEIFSQASQYFRIMVLSALPMFLFMGVQAVLRGQGEVKIPTYINGLGVLLNALLDPLFIFNLGLGLEGAALATLLTRTLIALVGLRFVEWTEEIAVDIIKKIIVLGIPASLEHVIRSIAHAIITAAAASLGTEVLAAYGVGLKVMGMVYIPAIGIAIASSILVGQKKDKEVVKQSLISIFVIMSLLGGIMFLLADAIAGLFITGKALELAAQFIRYVSLSFGFVGVFLVVLGTFKGLGNTLASLILASVDYLLLRVGLAYALLPHWGPAGIWIAFPIANVVSALIGLWALTRIRF